MHHFRERIPDFFFFEPCRRLFSFTPRKRQQCDNFFQLHSLEEIAFSLKVLIVSRLVPPLFLERWDCSALCWREFQKKIENLIFENTGFSKIPNSRWQKDLVQKCERIQYLVAQRFFFTINKYFWDGCVPELCIGKQPSMQAAPGCPSNPLCSFPFHCTKSLRCVKMLW